MIKIAQGLSFKKLTTQRCEKAGISHPSQMILTHRDSLTSAVTSRYAGQTRLSEEEPGEEKYRSRPWPEQVLGEVHLCASVYTNHGQAKLCTQIYLCVEKYIHSNSYSL